MCDCFCVCVCECHCCHFAFLPSTSTLLINQVVDSDDSGDERAEEDDRDAVAKQIFEEDDEDFDVNYLINRFLYYPQSDQSSN